MVSGIIVPCMYFIHVNRGMCVFGTVTLIDVCSSARVYGLARWPQLLGCRHQTYFNRIMTERFHHMNEVAL